MENFKFRLRHFLKCKIVGYENTKPRFFFCRAFTRYHIKVKEFLSRKSFVVNRRYSEFCNLKKRLQRLSVRIPQFPKKQFKGRFEPNFIRSRIKRFQEILNYLFRINLNHQNSSTNQAQKFQIIEVILEFLQVPQETISYIKQTFTSPFNKEITQAGDDNFVINFLNKIHYEKDFKSNTLREASNQFFNQKLLLKVKSIELLLRGMSFKSQQFQMKGLIQLCGETESRSVNHEALVFILKLIDSQYTQDFSQYLRILVTTETSILREMGLEKHIMDFKWSKAHALQILKYIYNHYLIEYPQDYEKKLLEIVNQQQVFDILLNEFTSIKAFAGEHEQDSPIHIPIQGAQGKQYMSQSLIEIKGKQSEQESKSNWKLVKHSNGVIFAHKFRNDNQSILQFKMKFTIEGCSPIQIAEYFTDYKIRALWDVKFIKGQIIESIKKKESIVSETFGNYNNGCQDQSIKNFTLIRNIETKRENQVIISYQPTDQIINFKKLLLPQGVQQATIYKMRYLITEHEGQDENYKAQRTLSNMIDDQINKKFLIDILENCPTQNLQGCNTKEISSRNLPYQLKYPFNVLLNENQSPKQNNDYNEYRQTYHFQDLLQSKVNEEDTKKVVIKYKCDLDTRAADLYRGDILQENDDLIQSIKNLQKLVNYGVEAYQEDQKSQRIYKLKSHNKLLEAVQKKNSVRQAIILESSTSFKDLRKSGTLTS